MKKSFAITFNIAYWICYYFLVLLVFFIATQAFNSPHLPTIKRAIVGMIIVPSTLSFYFTYLFVFPKFLKQANWFYGGIIGVLGSIGSAIVGFIFLFFIFHISDWNQSTWSTINGIFLMLAFIATANAVMGWVVNGFVTWFEEHRVKLDLQQQNHDMELALLRSKMDPHFLFNSLNNIDTLILVDAEKGSQYLNKLSDIIRFMLYETQLDEIPLSKELDYLKRYIELQKIRSINEDFVQLSVVGDAKNKTIAPVVFIPFVENAFKHCGNKKDSGAITISIEILDTHVTFQCINTIESREQGTTPSIGNQLIQDRLNLLYPESHELIIQNEVDLYHVTLTLNV